MINITLDTTRIRQQFAAMPTAIDKTIRATFKNTLFGGDLKPTMDRLMAAKIDRPVNFTSDGKGIAFYDKVNATGPLAATFGLKGKQGAYLQFMLKGSPRDQKIIERRTPDGRLLVPTKNVVLDSHGNVPKGVYLRMFQQAFASGGGEKREHFFLPKPRGPLPAGIYKRERMAADPTKTQPRLQFRAVDAMDYKKVWDFHKDAEREIIKRLPAAIEEAIAVRMQKLRAAGANYE